MPIHYGSPKLPIYSAAFPPQDYGVMWHHRVLGPLQLPVASKHEAIALAKRIALAGAPDVSKVRAVHSVGDIAIIISEDQ